jgi:hypothetical protein
MSVKTFPKKSGGYDNYSIRSATLVENYFPGPGRSNLIMDPDRALGKYDSGTYGSDEMIMDGPGSLYRSMPDATKYSYERIFEAPRGNPFRNFAVDDRQVAAYQVEQLNNNPLSQYTLNPDGSIPGFLADVQPDNFSNMTTKREDQYKSFFEGGDSIYAQQLGGTQAVYKQYTGQPVNANADVVYNLSMNSKENSNPMIALGSSSNVRTKPTFSGKAYSGNFVPGQTIDQGGSNPPSMYNNNVFIKKTVSDIGFMNQNVGQDICVPDRSLDFSNPLVLNYQN